MIPDNGHQLVVLTFSDAYGCLSGHHCIRWGAGVYGLLVKWWFFIKVNIFLNILVAFCVAMIHLMGSEVTPILCSDACLCRKITEQLLYLRFWNILYTDNVNILLNIITQTIISFRYISDNYQECMADVAFSLTIPTLNLAPELRETIVHMHRAEIRQRSSQPTEPTRANKPNFLQYTSAITVSFRSRLSEQLHQLMPSRIFQSLLLCQCLLGYY